MNEVEAIQNDDEFIFEQIYHRHHQKVYFFILRQLHNEHDAAEVVQLTFIKLWKGRKKLSPCLPLSQQLFQISKNCLIDHLRKQKREAQQKNDYMSVPEPVTVLPSENGAMLEQHLAAAIRKLPEVRREVFTLSRMHDLSHREIADRLSVSVKTVESHIYKALKQLRRALTHIFF